MKQIFSIVIPFVLIMTLILNQMLPADAAKKSAKKGLSKEAMTEITTQTDTLVKKIYQRELYTPEDMEQLIALKLRLDEQMDILPDASLAPLYFKVGNIFRLRNEKKDAIVCYQTILENFYDTAYGPKSRDILTEMGVEIRVPVSGEDDEESEI